MTPLPITLAFFGLPGHWEWILIAMVGLLLFGRRLPEVGRSLGRSIVEFKKGVKGIEDEIHEASNEPPRTLPENDPNTVAQSTSAPQGVEQPPSP